MNLVSSQLKSVGGFLNPSRIVRHLDIKRGDTVADFGAGHGYFTVPLAKIVGSDGRVYAIDIQKEPLQIIASKAKAEHLLNVLVIRGDLETSGGSSLKDATIDLVLISTMLFQAEDKEAVFREAYRVTHEKGILAIIEWDPYDHGGLGPPTELRVAKRNVIRMAESVSFKLAREFEAGEHHYGLLFVKQ